MLETTMPPDPQTAEQAAVEGYLVGLTAPCAECDRCCCVKPMGEGCGHGCFDGQRPRFPFTRECEDNPWCEKGKDPRAKDGVCHDCTDGRVAAVTLEAVLKVALHQLSATVMFDPLDDEETSCGFYLPGTIIAAGEPDVEGTGATPLEAAIRALAAAVQASDGGATPTKLEVEGQQDYGLPPDASQRRM